MKPIEKTWIFFMLAILVGMLLKIFTPFGFFLDCVTYYFAARVLFAFIYKKVSGYDY